MPRDPDPGWRLPAVIDPPKRCVQLWIPDDPSHIAAFWGALVQLGRWFNWERDNDKTALAVSRVWFDVFLKATEDFYHNPCNCPPKDGECRSYAATAPFVDFAPQDPRIDPNLIPPGYIRPPWYIVTSGNITDFATGVQIGDVLTDLTRFPTGSLPTIIPPDGFARFRVNITGRADGGLIEVELHFVKYPLGGMALITVDGNLNPSTWEFVGLNKDLISAPPETNTEIIIEKSILGSGKHFIDVTILPFVNDQAPFVYYGGGIRRIVICGADLPAPSASSGNCGNCGGLETGDFDMAIRFNKDECRFEQSIDNTNWCPIWDGWLECITDLLSSGSGETGEIPEGECVSIKRNLEANQVYRSNYPVKQGYTIDIVKMSGAATDGTPEWKCPDGSTFVLGACLGGSNFKHEDDDPDPVNYHMAVVGRIGSLYFGGWEGQSFTVPSTVPNLTDLEFLRNDGTLADNSGSTYAEITICRPQGVGSGSGIQLVAVSEDLNLTITALGGLKWHVSAPYNNSPTGGGDPVTAAQVILVDGDNVNIPAHWIVSNMTGWADVASYANNGAVFLGINRTGAVLVPRPLTGFDDWMDYFNTTYPTTNVYSIDVGSTVAASALEFDIEVTV
jgi:hypothetical protein